MLNECDDKHFDYTTDITVFLSHCFIVVVVILEGGGACWAKYCWSWSYRVFWNKLYFIEQEVDASVDKMADEVVNVMIMKFFNSLSFSIKQIL